MMTGKVLNAAKGSMFFVRQMLMSGAILSADFRISMCSGQ